ncbi:hypothetical protein NPIL_576861 [Nephila pilipes]|uniref:Uncharacterized protein n=1 Tax=Nephila pilipes TaxID=299642 RepID=A0A8X6TG08_NEPPI|nr:hypothetical protein NPIL_576861 [Nephila pilipes]
MQTKDRFPQSILIIIRPGFTSPRRACSQIRQHKYQAVPAPQPVLRRGKRNVQICHLQSLWLPAIWGKISAACTAYGLAFMRALQCFQPRQTKLPVLRLLGILRKLNET